MDEYETFFNKEKQQQWQQRSDSEKSERVSRDGVESNNGKWKND